MRDKAWGAASLAFRVVLPWAWQTSVARGAPTGDSGLGRSSWEAVAVTQGAGEAPSTAALPGTAWSLTPSASARLRRVAPRRKAPGPSPTVPRTRQAQPRGLSS